MKKIISLIMLLVSFVSVSAQDADSLYASGLLAPGTKVPEFAITNIKGEKISPISSNKGKYIVLDFWASWCPECRKDIPEMCNLYKEYSSDEIAFVSVSFDKDKAAWQKCVENNNMVWTQCSELKPWNETTVSKMYNIKWIPAMYVIAPDGKVMLRTIEMIKVRKILSEIKNKKETAK